MSGASTYYVDQVVFDAKGALAGWEQRPIEIFLDRDLDYERTDKHLGVLPPAACLAAGGRAQAHICTHEASGYRLQVSLAGSVRTER